MRPITKHAIGLIMVVGALGLVACASKSGPRPADHPKSDHPTDHPKGDHPKSDHPKGEHPK